MPLTIPISDLWSAPGFIDPNAAESSAIDAQLIAERYGFLPGTVRVELDGDTVRIAAPAVPSSKQEQVRELTERAGRRAAGADYTRAIEQYKRVLEMDPLEIGTYRDLAMAYLAKGDAAMGREYLRRLLLLSPRDAWAWVILGNQTKQQGNASLAERYLARGLELNPNDPYARNSLGAIYAERGDFERSETEFKKALAENPRFANSQMGLAMVYQLTGRHAAAFEQVETLFRTAKVQDARAVQVFENASRAYVELAETLAKQNLEAAESAVDRLRQKAEAVSGCRIEIGELPEDDHVLARAEIAWKRKRDHHIIRTRAGLSEPRKLHLQAHEITHIILEAEARASRSNRWLSTDRNTAERAFSDVSHELSALIKSAGSVERAAPTIQRLVEGLVSQIYNIPLDMTIERKLAAECPELKYAQILADTITLREALGAVSRPEITAIVPKRILRASRALNCAFAMAVDERSNGALAASLPYTRLPDHELGQRLFSLWKEADSTREPGDEYDVVDRFARELRLTGWFKWLEDRGEAPAPDASPSGSTNPELLRAKSPAAVFYFLDVLRKFEDMSIEQIRSVAFEAALKGQNGLDYADPAKKYELTGIDGKLSGLQMMCFMYAGFQRFAPEHDLQMNLHEAYAEALAMHNSAR